MALPETIPVRYTEEEAEYVSVRPVVRQTFRLEELVDMVLGVTGKDAVRVQQVLRAGTVVFNFYRYWWPGVEASEEELREILARFPDAEPGRSFRPEECASMLFEAPGSPPRVLLLINRKEGQQRRMWRSKSVWDCVMHLTVVQRPAYEGYSYARRADEFRLTITNGQSARLLLEIERLAARGLAGQIKKLTEVAGVVFLCPRAVQQRKEESVRQA